MTDSLTIYDGGSNTSPMLGNPYCGDSLPPSQISSSNQLFFHFHSNYGGTATGFKLEYNATSKNHYTLLGSGSEWPKDKALPLTMVSYLFKQHWNQKRKKILWVEMEIIPFIHFHPLEGDQRHLLKKQLFFTTSYYVIWLQKNSIFMHG